MNACCILGPSAGPQAAVKRVLVTFPTRPGVVLSCSLVYVM